MNLAVNTQSKKITCSISNSPYPYKFCLPGGNTISKYTAWTIKRNNYWTVTPEGSAFQGAGFLFIYPSTGRLQMTMKPFMLNEGSSAEFLHYSATPCVDNDVPGSKK